MSDDTLRAALHRRQWLSEVPTVDSFDDPIKDTFIDGSTVYNGSWALMTPANHAKYGRGLGTGRGQMYKREDDGKWYKVAG